jgi:hypothetical protein
MGLPLDLSFCSRLNYTKVMMNAVKTLLTDGRSKLMLRLSAEDRRLLGLLITPSWLSCLVAVVVGLALSIGVIIAFEAHNSQLQQQLLSWQQTKPQPALTTPDQTVIENDRPTARGSWSLLLVWSLVGLLVYGFVAVTVRSIARAEALRESLDYVNARRGTMLASTAEHLLLRLNATALLVGCAIAFWRQIVPYSITAAHASATDIISLYGGLYALLAFALVAVSLHIQTILLRLALGRTRVFSESYR